MNESSNLPFRYPYGMGGQSCPAPGDCNPGGPSACTLGSQGSLPNPGAQAINCFGSLGSICEQPAECGPIIIPPGG